MSTQIRVMLVDDVPDARQQFREMLAAYPDILVAGQAGSREEALALLQTTPVDVLFSDIQMQGGSGFELAEAVHRMHPGTQIVFLTGYAEFALDGYIYGPIDFLVKPVTRERLERTLERVRESLSGVPRHPSARLGFQTGNGYQIVNTQDIAYLERENRRVLLVRKDGSTESIGKSMQEVEELLSDYGFFRCHQSYLVPVADIERIEKDAFGRTYRIRLHDSGQAVPLSRKKYYALRDILREEGVFQAP